MSISEKKLKIDETAVRREVNCFGDSLTFSYGGDGITYPGTLMKLLGDRYEVNNLGIGGESTITIAGRQGSIPMHVEAFTIPAEVKAVEIHFMNIHGETPKPLRQGEAGVNPCYLNGIKGNLSITQSTTTSDDVKWYFTREEEGEEEVSIGEAEELITQASLFRRTGILILWTGTNDGLENPVDSAVDRLIEKQKIMIDYLKDTKKQYIVLGLTHLKNINPSGIDDINRKLEQVYGSHFLNIKVCLLEEGLLESGLQETDQDKQDIRSGNIPESLRVDDVHFNAQGYAFIGQQVYRKGTELGYW